jgi:hypothetical protein
VLLSVDGSMLGIEVRKPRRRRTGAEPPPPLPAVPEGQFQEAKTGVPLWPSERVTEPRCLCAAAKSSTIGPLRTWGVAGCYTGEASQRAGRWVHRIAEDLRAGAPAARDAGGDHCRVLKSE